MNEIIHKQGEVRGRVESVVVDGTKHSQFRREKYLEKGSGSRAPETISCSTIMKQKTMRIDESDHERQVSK